MKTSLIALAMGCAGALAAPANAASTFTITDLGTLGGVASWGYGINNSGQVAGAARITAGTQHATLWTGSTKADLGSGSVVSQANDLNNAGVAVGYVAARATVWADGSATMLQQMTGSTLSYANSINDSGQIVGYSNYTGAPEYHAVLWNSSTAAPVDLGTLGGTYSYAQDINNAGQVVGVAALANGGQRAALWENGSVTNLGTLGGNRSYAYSINEAGQIVGYSSLAGDAITRATLWDDGTITDLGTLGGATSQAFGINASGQVVGYSATTGGSNPRAFLWQDGVMSDLNALIDPTSGWTLLRAEAVNDSGQIVGYGTYQGQTRAFLLNAVAPVPEPATWAMMIGGFALAGVAMRRRATVMRFA